MWSNIEWVVTVATTVESQPIANQSSTSRATVSIDNHCRHLVVAIRDAAFFTLRLALHSPRKNWITKANETSDTGASECGRRLDAAAADRITDGSATSTAAGLATDYQQAEDRTAIETNFSVSMQSDTCDGHVCDM